MLLCRAVISGHLSDKRAVCGDGTVRRKLNFLHPGELLAGVPGAPVLELIHYLILHLRLYREVVVKSMSRNLTFVLFRALMVWMVAISLLTTGFSHRPAQTAAQIDEEIYLAGLGLTVADICAEPGDEGSGMAMGDCPACHLAGSVLLPEAVASLIDIELRTYAALIVPAEAHILGRRTNPATPVRAPPQA